VTQIVRRPQVPLPINAPSTTFVSGYDGESEITGTVLIKVIDGGEGGDGSGYVVLDSSGLASGPVLVFLDRETGDYFGDVESGLGTDGIRTISVFSPQSILLTAGDITDPELVRDIVIQHDGAVRICVDGVDQEYDLLRFNPDLSLVIQPTKIGFFNNSPVAQPATIANPSGGSVVDGEARAAIVALLDAFRESTGGNGLIA
jgi:hypothetical protein